MCPPFPNCINYTTINQYILGSNLGQGNYAQVKSAIHKDTGFKVAIKIYDKLKLHSNQQVKKSVSREIKLLSALCNTERTSGEQVFSRGHENIMRLFDAIDTPKQLYLICENIEGKMLHNILRQMPGRRLHAKICARIFKQIVFGMAAYHEQWICHRDLKPENILVNMDCPHYTTKIIDFGFATKSKEKLQIFCGTPAFMSPEIC